MYRPLQPTVLIVPTTVVLAHEARYTLGVLKRLLDEKLQVIALAQPFLNYGAGIETE